MGEASRLKAESIRELRKVSDKEKELARQVWRQVEKDYETYGVVVFKELFRAFPTYKRFFLEAIGNDEDPFLSPRFHRHMLQVLLPTLGGVLNQLDSPEAVHEALKRLGVLHRRKEIGLRRENVETLGHVLLTALRQKIKGFTEQQEQALSKILLIIVNIFSNGLEGKTG